MPSFICPVCGCGLNRYDKTYICENRHSFDISKEGYVNLLMASGHGKRHGDDKMMVRARTEFLNKGYYDKFSTEISELAVRYSHDGTDIIDCGCGECKYTVDIKNALEKAGISAGIAGIDISKDALRYGAKRKGDIPLAVASVGNLPFSDASADMIINLFAPFSDKEFCRVLRPHGKVIRAYPLRKHLFELKKLIYDTPYENEETDMTESGFEMIEKREVRYNISVGGDDLMQLFMMTPYYYKTGEKDQNKAKNADITDVSLEFGIIVYEKI